MVEETECNARELDTLKADLASLAKAFAFRMEQQVAEAGTQVSTTSQKQSKSAAMLVQAYQTCQESELWGLLDEQSQLEQFLGTSISTRE